MTVESQVFFTRALLKLKVSRIFHIAFFKALTALPEK